MAEDRTRPRARSGVRAGARPHVRPSSAARSRTAPAEPRGGAGWVRGAVLATIFVMLAVTLVPTARSVIRQRSQIAALTSTIATQQQDVTALTAEQKRWTDPAYVQQQARERLKFVKPGERSYSVIDPATQAPTLPSGTTVAAPSSSGTLPWYGQVWESVELADRPTAGMEPVDP